jgi:polysaccharide pyruvyl transferase WcaK-like protein
LRFGGVDKTTDGTDIGESQNPISLLVQRAGKAVPEPRPRIALLTPYTGGNLGDAAIQDAMIANIRLRLPGAEFSGISLNCDNFVEQHGVHAFSLCATSVPFYSMCSGKVAGQPGYGEDFRRRSNQKGLNTALIKRALKRVPVLGWCLKTVYACLREFRHFMQGYRFLRAHDLLIVSGGGQMNEEWGGPWGQPFALFKWAVLARIAQVPYVIASVGAGRAISRTSRLFLSLALRMAQYRSYRDKNSGTFAAGLLPIASKDPIVPDLAFSLPLSEIPPPAGIRALAQGRPIIAISLIAYANPRFWPSPDRALYDRYVGQMTSVVSQLLEKGCFLVMVYSSLGDDQSVIPELLGRLNRESEKRLARQMCCPMISTWKKFVASLLDVDCLIASRLHSAILGFVSQRPTIAISFDPKVDWVMENLGLADYLLHIRDFTAEDVIEALDRAKRRRDLIAEQISAHQDLVLSASAQQFDALARLAMAGRRHRHRGNYAALGQ